MLFYMRKTPNLVCSIGLFSAADSDKPRIFRVSTGSITPSSQIRAVEKYGEPSSSNLNKIVCFCFIKYLHKGNIMTLHKPFNNWSLDSFFHFWWHCLTRSGKFSFLNSCQNHCGLLSTHYRNSRIWPHV